MEIRKATIDDAQALAAIEAACFPAAEAATAGTIGVGSAVGSGEGVPGGFATV